MVANDEGKRLGLWLAGGTEERGVCLCGGGGGGKELEEVGKRGGVEGRRERGRGDRQTDTRIGRDKKRQRHRGRDSQTETDGQTCGQRR